MMEYSISKKVQEAGLVLGAFGVIGFIGIVWLMIYGNLTGNLGWTAESDSYVNITGAKLDLTDIYTISEKSDFNFTSWAVSEVWNSSVPGDYVLLTSGNYTVDGVAGTIVNATATVYPLVNLTYTTSVKGTNELNTDAVTDNLTGGFLTFFGFSGTWFTIAAVVLLIFMLVGLLAIVMNIAAMQGKAGSGKYSGN